MAQTFSDATFPVENYAAYRPTYPPQLYETIMGYHRGETALAVDLGCGTGIVAAELAQRKLFERVIGIDPSKSMLEYAKKTVPNVEFVNGRAESIPWLKTSSVDAIFSGTAAHWFDPAWWKEASRILKPNGTIAVFIYGGFWPDPCHPHAPQLRTTMFSFAEDLGFSFKGNEICHGMYDQLPLPHPTQGELDDFERIDWNRAGLGDRLIMASRMNLRTWRERVYTYGPMHRWKLENLTKVGSKTEDPAERTVEALKRILGSDEENTEFECGHSLSLILYRQKASNDASGSTTTDFL